MAESRVDDDAMAEQGRGSANPRLRQAMALGISLCFVGFALWHFHDRTWWPPDDGVYGYVAQRILAGDVLNGNLHDLHAGYVNFLHAAALWLFGENLVALRYPLVLLTLLQSALAFLLLRDRGAAYAAVGAMAAGTLSFVLFVNPSANWYAQIIAIGAIALLAVTPPGDARREIALGALVIATFLFRQLSGVFLGIGVLTWLLLEPRVSTAGGKLVARLLAFIMALAIAGYLWAKGSIDGALIFGIWPLGLAVIALARTQLDNKGMLILVARLVLGGVLIALPLLVYHLIHGSLHSWVEDAFLSALHVTTLDFVDRANFWHLAAMASVSPFRTPGIAATLNAMFWLALLIAPVALGIGAGGAAVRGRRLHPLPIVASVFAVNSMHYEIWIYLVFTSALCIVALMWMLGTTGRGRLAGAGIALFLVTVSLAFQAGQPTTRSLKDVMAGNRVELNAPDGLPGASLVMTREEQETYRRLLALIEANAQPGEAILALPFQPELYFLSGHRSIFDFYVTTLSLRDNRQISAALERFATAAPPIVIHRPEDKYNNWASDALMQEVKRRYRYAERIGLFDIYLPATAPSP